MAGRILGDYERLARCTALCTAITAISTTRREADGSRLWDIAHVKRNPVIQVNIGIQSSIVLALPLSTTFNSGAAQLE